MAFRSKFQVPAARSLKESGCPSYLLQGKTSLSSVLKENVRFFWFRKPKNEAVQQGTGNCGKPPPVCMDLVCKGGPSKCIKEAKSQEAKKVKEKKPKEKSLEDMLTWWEKIFGPSPKRFWPDPCTCRLAHREKKKKRSIDPRLCDPRYQMTAGDVFLYTEPIKRNKNSCSEPQPKPPPAYKLPKAALVRMIGNLCDQPPIARIGLHEESPECKKLIRIKSYKLPYEEMRPPHRRRKQFFCYKGVPPEDVQQPINRDLHLYQTLQKQSNEQCKMVKDYENFQQNQETICVDELAVNQKRSRVEQLKFLVNRKNTGKSITSSSS